MAVNQEKENTPEQEQTKPWGRFTFVSKEPAEDTDHIYFRSKVTTIGRNKRRCDIVIDKLFISSVHCVVQLNDTNDTGKPIVKLSDNSRNGIWVNADRVGKGASVTLGNGYTVHFTKPGTTPAGVTPMAYKFEFLNDTHDSGPASPESEENEVPEDVNMTVVEDESIEATQLDVPEDPPSPSEKKRKREDEEPAPVTVATQELECKLKAAESQLKATQDKLKAAEAQASTLTEDLEQNVRVKVDKLSQENLTLMSKLDIATAVNLQLKTDLAAKDKDTQVKIKDAMKKSMDAASKDIQSLKEELIAKDKAMGMKLQDAVKKALEADKEKRSQEMATKLKEATKKYQQKVEAEHYEQRREMSEKMAAYANENEKLQTTLSTKEEELVESEDKIARLRKKVGTLEEETSKFAEKEKKIEDYEEKTAALEDKIKMFSDKEKKLAECEETIAELEEKINTAKDENSEIMGILAAAEEKVAAAENKAAEATIAAKAAKVDATERQELRDAIKSLRSEIETYRAQLASRDEELKRQQEAAAAAATAATVSSKCIAPGDDAEALRARLAAALNLLSQIQALGLQGVSLITGTNNPNLGDLHLLSAASARTSTSVPNSPSSSPNEDIQQNEEDPEDSPVKTEAKAARKLAAKEVPRKKDHVEDAVNGAAEPKSSPMKLKREKKKAFKQAAPLSAAIETKAASAIAAMASANSSAKNSPTDASAGAANGDGGDWEMLD